jgi:hypothetical protein
MNKKLNKFNQFLDNMLEYVKENNEYFKNYMNLANMTGTNPRIIAYEVLSIAV